MPLTFNLELNRPEFIFNINELNIIENISEKRLTGGILWGIVLCSVFDLSQLNGSAST